MRLLFKFIYQCRAKTKTRLQRGAFGGRRAPRRRGEQKKTHGGKRTIEWSKRPTRRQKNEHKAAFERPVCTYENKEEENAAMICKLSATNKLADKKENFWRTKYRIAENRERRRRPLDVLVEPA